MQVLIAPLEDFALGEKTSLTADSSVGATSLSCNNGSGFSANQFVIIGHIGKDTAEVKKISSVNTASTTIRVAATLFAHDSGEPIQVIRYDQRKFYRSTTEGGTYSHLSTSGSPVNISVDDPEGTEFEDTDGTSANWYKATYYNSYDATETDLTDAIATQANDSNHYATIYMVKSEAGFENNPFISSEIVDRYRDEAEAIIDGMIAKVYTLPLSYTSKIIQRIAVLLSAGSLMHKEFSSDADISIVGEKKIAQAYDLLQKIVDQDILLLNATGTPLSPSSVNLSSCNNTYADDNRTGEYFNLADEHFSPGDPANPLSSNYR